MAEKVKPPQDVVTEIGVDDLYEFLGVESTSSEKEITSGYRRKALKYHPDKNPDNPSASDLFIKLSKAYHILTDPAAKAAYDKWLKAKYAAKKRHEELNAKRRKLKETLEMREGQSQSFQKSPEELLAAKQMQKEINRLREEGFKRIKEQEEFLRQQLQKQNAVVEDEDVVPSLKVTWKAKKGDPSNGGYSNESLEKIFSKFGVHHILVSRKKNGKAVISFHSSADAYRALESECGMAENPLQIAWAGGECTCRPSAGVVTPKPGPVDVGERDEDYESITFMRLQQAEERKRLNQSDLDVLVDAALR